MANTPSSSTEENYTRYTFFSSLRNRKKTSAGHLGIAQSWWTRDKISSSFRDITTQGTVSTQSMNSTSAVVPFLCL